MWSLTLNRFFFFLVDEGGKSKVDRIAYVEIGHCNDRHLYIYSEILRKFYLNHALKGQIMHLSI